MNTLANFQLCTFKYQTNLSILSRISLNKWSVTFFFYELDDIFEGGDENPHQNMVTKTVTHDPAHHKTVTKTTGPGFQSVVVTEVIGPGHMGMAGGNGPVIIPIFRQPRRIHLKKVGKEENPFKIFQELDQVFESFLEGFARGLNDDDDGDKHQKAHKNANAKAQQELQHQIDKMEHDIKNEHVVVTNIRDITNEVKE